MKIIQVATLVSPDGAYGGPIRVAVNQVRALRAAGNEVELVAGARGFSGSLPTEFDGVPVKLFPAYSIPKLGFSGTFAPALQAWLRTNIANADALHVHLGRDMVTLPAALHARKLGIPYVLQTHGMVGPSAHPLAGVVDRTWTRPVTEGASSLLYLTRQEKEDIGSVFRRHPKLVQLPNGVPTSSEAAHLPTTSDLEVLFLARLHERKRPLLFIEMAKRLHPAFPNVRFVMVGPDGGQGVAVREAIGSSGMSHRLSWEGAIAPKDTGKRLRQCDIYVLPSVDEPFPMSVLEALAEGKPAVVTDSCGLAEHINLSGAGSVVDSSLEALQAAVRNLLGNHDYRKQAGRRAKALVESDFSMTGVVSKLEKIYQEATQRA